MRHFSFCTTLALLAPLAACNGSVSVLSTVDGGTDAEATHPTADASRADAAHTADSGARHDAGSSVDANTSTPDAVADVAAAKGCLADGGLPPLACSSNSECPCPTGCIVNTALSAQEGDTISTCQVLCTTSADCSDPGTACKNGGCEQELCAGDGGTGTPFGTCETGGVSGTCVPSSDATGFSVFECFAGGTVASGGTCKTDATRSEPSNLCVAGLVCAASGVGTTGTCAAACSIGTSTKTCPSGTACASTLSSVFDAPSFGACLPTSGSGNTECVTGISNELEACSSTAACGCVTGGTVECVTDPSVYNALTLSGFLGTSFATQTFCERTCSTSADCPNPLTTCGSSGHCTYNLCGNADAGTGFGASCDAGGVTGICYASWQDYQDLPDNPNGGFGLPYGVCIPGGAIADGAACSPSGQKRTDPSTLCVAGDLCAPSMTSATGGICRATCLISEDEIDNSAECTGGGTCSEDAIGGVIGYCCASFSATGECE